jgi:dTDP-4-dehydrorhamnose reductase
MMTDETRRRILITGGAGLLAPFLLQAGQVHGHIDLTTRRDGSFPCDLADAEGVARMVGTARPDVVIHCAAMTDVDGCERNADAADRGNRLTSENLAAALPANRQLVYISTDQVYPNVAGPHVEGTEDPVNVYGRSKLAGERAALRHPGGVALRASFFGASRTPGRKSLSDFIVENLSAQKHITLFSDILFTPLHATTLASIIFETVEHRLTGVYNVASRDGSSKADFALGVAAHFGLQTDTAAVGKSTAQTGRAIRTTDLRMAPDRLVKALARTMPTLQQEIKKL